jgi:hypothetical protein
MGITQLESESEESNGPSTAFKLIEPGFMSIYQRTLNTLIGSNSQLSAKPLRFNQTSLSGCFFAACACSPGRVCEIGHIFPTQKMK